MKWLWLLWEKLCDLAAPSPPAWDDEDLRVGKEKMRAAKPGEMVFLTERELRALHDDMMQRWEEEHGT